MSVLARAIVEAEINGELTKAVHVDESHMLRHPTPYLELRKGPVTSIQSVTINDILELEPGEYRMSNFGVERLGLFFPANCAVTVSYTTGWDEGQEPERIKQALLLTDRWLESNPESGITEYRSGDESVKRAASTLEPPQRA